MVGRFRYLVDRMDICTSTDRCVFPSSFTVCLEARDDNLFLVFVAQCHTSLSSFLSSVGNHPHTIHC